MGRTKRRAMAKPPPSPKKRAIRPKLVEMFAAATAHLKQGHIEAARDVYKAILKKSPKHAPSLHHLGLVEHKSGNSGKAVELIGKALAIDPKNFEAQANLAAILEMLGRIEEGFAACKAALVSKIAMTDRLPRNGSGTTILIS